MKKTPIPFGVPYNAKDSNRRIALKDAAAATKGKSAKVKALVKKRLLAIADELTHTHKGE